MRVSYSKEKDSAYIYLSGGVETILRTEFVSPFINVDLDKHDHPIGIELFQVSEWFDPDDVKQIVLLAHITRVGAFDFAGIN